MNRSQFKVLLFVGVILGLVGFFVYQRDRSSWGSADTKAGSKAMPDLPINDVAQVTIQQTGKEVTLLKKDDVWSVRERSDYPANFTQLSASLRKLWEMKAV